MNWLDFDILFFFNNGLRVFFFFLHNIFRRLRRNFYRFNFSDLTNRRVLDRLSDMNRGFNVLML